ncbi:SH3-domain-containing protein [Mycena chlorophos]|uniref:SH3-domain-containing protein n=1 Tax=Mycena chlorophos TaxID=658473 RepID=A0A8H6WMV6_MYCCL|nr:SH3-domain-containing protein [Mycena chlorophos]
MPTSVAQSASASGSVSTSSSTTTNSSPTINGNGNGVHASPPPPSPNPNGSTGNPDGDPNGAGSVYTYAPSASDFCNSFWGSGDAGAGVLFARMRTARAGMRALEAFWRESKLMLLPLYRAAIEDEYAKRLLSLAKTSLELGDGETGELKRALAMLISETKTQATAHSQFAMLVREELQAPIGAYAQKQADDDAALQAPLEARCGTKHAAEAAITKAREKYESNCLRLASHTQQLSVTSPGRDAQVERLQAKIKKSQETVAANEKELAQAVGAIREATVRWQRDWKAFCDICQDSEEERLEFVKDVVWGSCERIRVALDNVDTVADLDIFVDEYGTGNAVPEPPTWMPFDANSASVRTSTTPAEFSRVSSRPPMPVAPPTTVGHDDAGSVPPTPRRSGSMGTTQQIRTRKDSTPSINGRARSRSRTRSQSTPKIPASVPPTPSPNPPPGSYPGTSQSQSPPPSSASNTTNTNRRKSSSQASLRRVSGPLPAQPGTGTRSPTPAPIPAVPPLPQAQTQTGDADADGERILFFVQALYDYAATTSEEFDFEAGDVIAVRATPDDGWWSGELLDERRREEGRHIFPSNFITLF